MKQEEYIQAIDEMEIPGSKIMNWTRILRKEFYDQLNETDQGHFDRIFESSQKIVDLIPKLKLLTGELEKLRAITHEIGGPIIVVRDYTKILIARLNAHLEIDDEYSRYLRKINSAAEYLYSLDRDILLKMM